VQQFNPGKRAEYDQRKTFKVNLTKFKEENQPPEDEETGE